jgi:hypothetical protein
MVSRSRFVFSLVVALSLSTLALADCAPASGAFLHSSAGFSGWSHVYSGSGNDKRGFHAGVSSSGNGGQFIQLHGTTSRKNGNWGAWHVGAPSTSQGPAPLATPEPGSLMLLSTGLMGIAGIVRRKLLLV